MSLFYIIIKDPLTDSILGWCKFQDLENLRRSYPHLLMTPFPARFSEQEMNVGTLYCGPEECAKHPSLMAMLKLYDDLVREKKETEANMKSLTTRILGNLKRPEKKG